MSQARFRTLISVAELQALQHGGAAIVLLDCGFDLADPHAGERAHAQAHLTGAHHAHLDRDLSSAKTGRNGRHPLPDRAALMQRTGDWGVAPGIQVVCYDAQGGHYASRAWWLLRWLGHEAVAVLDGGFAAWSDAGGTLSSAPTEPGRAAPYPAGPAAMPTVDAETLLTHLGQRPILDARAGERFRGEVEPLDTVAGHIPGALNRFFKDNLHADGRFKPAAQLRDEFKALGLDAGQAPVHQCGSGVTACHNLLAMEHAGLHGSVLYPGSWSEWCADPKRPVAVG